jgi:hypothetical protein
MTRLKKCETLIKILEAIQYFENQIAEKEWEIEFGVGLIFPSICDKNKHRIVIYKMCIVRLNERFIRLSKTLK